MIQYDSDRFSRRLNRLRRHGRWIAVGAGLSALAALLVSLILPKIYRATTYLVVSESKIGASSQNPAWQYYTLLPTYVPFVDSDALISQAIRRFRLDQAPYELTLERFRKKDYLDVRNPKSTRLIEIDVEFPDAQLAADLANYLAQSSVVFNEQMNAADTAATQKFLKERLDQAVALQTETEATRLRVKEEARIEDKEKSLSILLDAKGEVAAQLEKLRMSVAQSEARVLALQQALRGEPKVVSLKKSITSDRFLERASEKLLPAGEDALSITEETLSATHEEMQRQFVTATSDTEAGRAGIRAATTRTAEIDGAINRTLADLTRSRIAVEKSDREVALAREGLESATRDYRNASVTATSKSNDLKQVSPALVPERPVRPRILLNVVLASLLSLILLSGIALGIEGWREMRQEPPRYLPEDETVSARAS
ncbi:MAG: hypothetical protein HYS33_08395 [Acidobacteria bacterium]|nr:hypothetical protein [Acidobacteriota bacterium]MBI1983373.1 hypothetical protein [Acidobacteriota bacterium]